MNALTLNRITRITHGVIALTLLVPLLTLPEHFLYPFIVPKVLWFRILIEILIAVWIVLVVASRERFAPEWTPVSLLMALFLASFAASTLVAVDPYRSLWDSHERMLGLFTLAHYVLFYFVLTTVVRGWPSWRALFLVFLGMSSAVMGIACVQKWVDPSFLYHQLSQDPNRVSSTLGHPSYLGGLGSFTALLAFYCVTRSRTFSPTAAFTIVAGALGIVGVVLSETRGSLVALSAGVGCLLLCYALGEKRGSRLRSSLVAVLLLGTIGVGALYSLRNREGLARIPALRRFQGVSLERETARTRVIAWGIAIDAARERPLLGWGPNNYYYAFNERYEPELLLLGFEETWWDNPHNVLLNVLAVQGVVGLLIYVGLLGASPALLWRKFRRGGVDRHTAALGCAFITTHLVGNLFAFENPTSWLYFVLMLAFIDSTLRGETETGSEIESAPSMPFPLLAWGVAPVVFVLIWLANVTPARANRAGLHAIRHVVAGRYEEALAAFDASSAMRSPHIDGLRQNLAESISRKFDALTETVAGRASLRRGDEGLLKLTVQAYDELAKSQARHPLDVRVPMARATLALKLASTYSEAELDGVDRVSEAEGELLDAQPRSPRRQEIQYLLAAMKIDGGLRPRRALRALRALEMIGDYEAAAELRTQIERDRERRGREAIALLRASIESEPRVPEGWWRLAVVHRWMGETAKARDVLEEALERGVELEGRGRAFLERLRASGDP